MNRRDFFVCQFGRCVLTLSMLIASGGVFLLPNLVLGIESSVVINEICPTGCTGKDHQWVEVYNSGEVVVDLKEWRFWENDTNHKLVISSSSKANTLGPKEYGVIVQKDSVFFEDYPDTTSLVLDSSWGTLKKSGEEVGIKNSEGELVDSVVYGSVDSFSLERVDSGNWKEHPSGNTVGTVNYWSLAGQEETQEKIITKEDEEEVILYTEPDSFVSTTEELPVLSPVEDLVISEFLPDPAGSDNLEFIELSNPTKNAIDLSGIMLDDMDGGSKAYTFPLGSMIDPDEYLVLGRYETKLALNNNGDSVRLLNEDGQVILESSYTDAPEGAARVLGDKDGWMWTKTPTPGQKNIIKAVEEKKITKSVVNVVKQVRLNELFGLAKGTKVQTSGVVVVEPDIFSSQYIYITDKDNSAGVQVYMYTKDWPDLVAGDEISVIGEISEAYGQKRVKIKAREDIKRMGPVQSMSISTTSISNIDESDVGRLMKINGEVTEIKSLYMYVDDGDEIKVGFKKGTGVGKKDFMIGDLVAITGVLVSSKEEFQLLPRSMEDIVKTNLPDIPEVGLNKKKGKKRKYLGVVAIGTVLVLMGLFVKSKEVCEKDGGRKVENVVSLVLDKIKSLWG